VQFNVTGTARFSCHLRKSGVKKIEWQEYRAVLFNRGFPSFSYLNYRLIVIQSVLKRVWQSFSSIRCLKLTKKTIEKYVNITLQIVYENNSTFSQVFLNITSKYILYKAKLLIILDG
jgi:hypothetical protein